MIISRPFVVHCLRTLYHSRSLHDSRKRAVSFRRVNLSESQPSRKPSLFEELFPEVQRDGNQGTKSYDHAQEVPRLPLPEIDDFLDGFEPESNSETSNPQRVTKAAAANAFRQQQVAVLSLETGSKSLVESDFRRVAPKGQHIDHWTGPGDILKSKFRKREREILHILTSQIVSQSFLYETLPRLNRQVATLSCSPIPRTLEPIRAISSVYTKWPRRILQHL